MTNQALVVGASGIVGSALSRLLADEGWNVAGLARRPNTEADIGTLSSPWHTDADLGRPIEVVTDMSKSRKLGFLDYQASDEAFFDVFARLRAGKLIP